MISLITISCIVAAFTPVITKKLKKQDVALSIAQTSEIKSPCPDFGDYCDLCTTKYCIQCSLNTCKDGEFVDTQTCTCKSCKDDAKLDNCLKCHKENNDYICDQCEGGTETSKGYYLKGLDGNTYDKCQLCGTTAGKNNICFDGIEEKSPEYCENVPGYYCDGSTLKLCTVKFNNCESCDDKRCKTCRVTYYVDSATGTCKACPVNFCWKCDDGVHCTKCTENGQLGILNRSANRCEACSTHIENCSSCKGDTSAPYCIGCAAGYYTTNNNRTCSPCSTMQHCVLCNSDGCTRCEAGYYVNSSNTCSQCTISNCAVCAPDGKCSSCIQGYHLSEDFRSCEANTSDFSCSDSNFMRIGNLCVTRKNMGNSNELKIPSTVHVVNDGETCYSSVMNCCWKLKNQTTGCDDEYDKNYSGCNRTGCNWNAAKEICEKFDYAGKKWRLPTQAEMKKWLEYGTIIGAQGLGLCGNNDTQCYQMKINWCADTSCLGNETNSCYTYDLWTGTAASNARAYVYTIRYGAWVTDHQQFIHGRSVRCVTEME